VESRPRGRIDWRPMPSKKRLPDAGRSPRGQVIVEKIESENRLSAEALDRFRETVTERFERMEQKDLERDVLFMIALRDVKGGLETKIDIVETKVDQVDSRLRVVETKVEKIDSRLQLVETKVDRLEVKVDKLETKVEKIDARLQSVETKVDLLVPLEGRVSALERRPA
jgi:chromosome segregation ATPase